MMIRGNMSVPRGVGFLMGGGQEGWDIKIVSECEPRWAANPGKRLISKRFANAADLVNILEHNTMINVYIAPKYSQTLAQNQ